MREGCGGGGGLRYFLLVLASTPFAQEPSCRFLIRSAHGDGLLRLGYFLEGVSGRILAVFNLGALWPLVAELGLFLIRILLVSAPSSAELGIVIRLSHYNTALLALGDPLVNHPELALQHVSLLEQRDTRARLVA